MIGDNSLQGSSLSWPSEDRRRLISAYRRGGYPAAAQAFPNRSYGAVKSAVIRFRDGREMCNQNAPTIDRAAVRDKIRSLSTTMILDRLGDLMDATPRVADFRQ